MANFNLTGQKIKNTYGQVVQVDDSNKLVDGLGVEKQILTSSVVNFDTEVSRSAADAGFGGGGTFDTSSLVQNSTFNAYTSSNDSAVSGLDTRVDSLTAATSSYLTSLPSGVVSGSSQISYNGITNVPVGIVSGAAQLPQIGTNQTNITTNTSDITTNTSDITTNTSDITTLTAETSSYLTSVPLNFTASSILFEGGISNGTIKGGFQPSITDFSNIESNVVQGGKVVINANNAGDFGQVYASASSGGLVLASRENNTGYIIVADNSITTNQPITGSISSAISASYAVTASHVPGLAAPGLVNGTGGSSLKSADALLTGNANASGTYSIALGQLANATAASSIVLGGSSDATGTDAVAIARNANAAGISSLAIGQDATATGEDSVAIGTSASSSGIASITIGNGADAGGPRGIAIGENAGRTDSQDSTISIGVNADYGDSYGIGIGRNARGGYQGVGVGDSCNTGNYGVSLGAGSNTNGVDNGIAIGQNTSATGSAYQININNVIKYNYDATNKTQIGNVLNLPVQATLPTGGVGDLAVSGSSLYFHNGSTWGVIS